MRKVMLDTRQRHIKQNMHNTVDIEKRSQKNWVYSIIGILKDVKK